MNSKSTHPPCKRDCGGTPGAQLQSWHLQGAHPERTPGVFQCKLQAARTGTRLFPPENGSTSALSLTGKWLHTQGNQHSNCSGTITTCLVLKQRNSRGPINVVQLLKVPLPFRQSLSLIFEEFYFPHPQFQKAICC